jgi:hypothetical protein
MTKEQQLSLVGSAPVPPAEKERMIRAVTQVLETRMR